MSKWKVDQNMIRTWSEHDQNLSWFKLHWWDKYNKNLRFRIRVWVDETDATVQIMWQERKSKKQQNWKNTTRQADIVVERARSKTKSELCSWASW